MVYLGVWEPDIGAFHLKVKCSYIWFPKGKLLFYAPLFACDDYFYVVSQLDEECMVIKHGTHFLTNILADVP